MNTEMYCHELIKHYEDYFGVTGEQIQFNKGPIHKLHPSFFVLKLPPNNRYSFYCYCTVGMSADRNEDLIELFVYSPKESPSLVELLTVCASFHRNNLPLGLHHTVNIGQPWLDTSKCDYGYISLPYLDGEHLELFEFEERTIHCYWFIPITEAERDFKKEYGVEALEQVFEEQEFDYLNPTRESLMLSA